MIAYIALENSLDTLKDAGFATVVWVNSKVSLFTAYGAQYIGTQYCNGSLTIRSVLDNVIIFK